MYSLTGKKAIKGLSRIEQEERRKVNGSNVIDIPHKSICHFLNDELVNPLFLFQALSCVIWFLLKYYIYLGLILFLTLCDIVNSIYQLYKNQRILENQIQRPEQVQVVREDGRIEKILSEELVPDDIIVIPIGRSTVQCDALLLEGTCIVNQCSLTGKRELVNKTSIAHQPDSIETDEHTLYYGTQIVEARRPIEREDNWINQDSLITALVTATGYRTAKGKIINALLHPPPVNSKFEQHAIRFLYLLVALATVGFIYKLTITLIQPDWVLADIISCFDLYTICVPSSLTLVLSSNIQQTRERLKKEQITCNSPRSVTLAGSLNLICFEKTGTLTEEDFDVSQVVPCLNGCWIPPIAIDLKSSWKTLVDDQSTPPTLLSALATCHSLASFQGHLIGDPLEKKMFEATGCYLGRLPIHYRNFEEHLPIVTWWNGDGISHRVEVLHRFPFHPNLERSGVLCRWINVYDDPGGIEFFCKGSPARIMELCKPQSLPAGWFEMCNRYAIQGYRVLAIAHARFRLSLEDFANFQNGLLHLKREDLERPSTMDFLGFIVFENRLKDDTFQVINELAEASIRTVMMTGDSLETSLNEARECGMIGGNDIVEEIRIVDYQLVTTSIIQQSSDWNPRRHYLITGPVWNIVRRYHRDLLEECLMEGTIFARMSPSQKEELIEELKRVGYTVGVCGNGTSSALKLGDVSISLAVLEAPTWTSFTFQGTSISCIPELIRQGRWAISTAIGEAKFMAVSSLTQFLAILVLYSLHGRLDLSDGQFFMIDVTIIVLGWLTSWSRPASGRLSHRNPTDSILSPVVVTSFVLQVLAALTFLLLSAHLLHYQDWYQVHQPYQDSMLTTGAKYFTDGADPNLICFYVPLNYTNSEFYRNLWIKENMSGYTFENYTIFFMALFEFITLAVLSSTDRLFSCHNNRLKNWPFIGAVLVFVMLSLYLLLDTPCFVIRLLELQLPLEWSFRYILVGLIIGHTLTALFIKELIVNIGIVRLVQSDWWLTHFPTSKKIQV